MLIQSNSVLSRRIIMTRKILFPALIMLALIVSACSSGKSTPVAPAQGNPNVSAPSAIVYPTAVPTPSSAVIVMVGHNSSLGSFLVDSQGMTLYLLTQDSPGNSTCMDGCAMNWPPFTTNGTPIGSEGVNTMMLGTIHRADGTTQVTYNGWPLYHFAADKAAGDTNGEGKGQIWFVISPDGTKK
jgi:predicted lipoprotein with Yx(FWY)xxD motif